MAKEPFDSIMAGLKEALAWSRGEIELPVTEYPRQTDGTAPPKRRVVRSNRTGGTKNTS